MASMPRSGMLVPTRRIRVADVSNEPTVRQESHLVPILRSLGLQNAARLAVCVCAYPVHLEVDALGRRAVRAGGVVVSAGAGLALDVELHRLVRHVGAPDRSPRAAVE